jgi:hypothetical protein
VNAVEKLLKIAAMDIAVEAMKVVAHQHVILCVHFLLHKQRGAEAMMLLCPCAAMLEGEPVPESAIKAFAAKLNAVNMEREKADCEGSA